MVIHELKIRKNFADAIADGTKTFEIRKNDRGYQTGDRLRFTVLDLIDGEVQPVIHPLDGREYEIAYLLSGWGVALGYVALGIREVSDEDATPYDVEHGRSYEL
ncbi:MAG: DUF3850 domain-containing protein [Oscillospiraceae bacterium]|nr:DUF3850 domain-containing protein [Oscillospiraceae bacterium]